MDAEQYPAGDASSDGRNIRWGQFGWKEGEVSMVFIDQGGREVVRQNCGWRWEAGRTEHKGGETRGKDGGELAHGLHDKCRTTWTARSREIPVQNCAPSSSRTRTAHPRHFTSAQDLFYQHNSFASLSIANPNRLCLTRPEQIHASNVRSIRGSYNRARKCGLNRIRIAISSGEHSGLNELIAWGNYPAIGITAPFRRINLDVSGSQAEDSEGIREGEANSTDSTCEKDCQIRMQPTDRNANTSEYTHRSCVEARSARLVLVNAFDQCGGCASPPAAGSAHPACVMAFRPRIEGPTLNARHSCEEKHRGSAGQRRERRS
ncbi:hypothetical protein C8R44DRAFT_738967 [Mycena epipterygia]|nr:hypothetical protein C8R44DRAFT_738967 [Mycena epipterygia]